uniref:Uncharacterized protein n=1 Tax=Rhizophora mucronata TaxID=61149 RepID=A0A2P2KEH7_RHIMU
MTEAIEPQQACADSTSNFGFFDAGKASNPMLLNWVKTEAREEFEVGDDLESRVAPVVSLAASFSEAFSLPSSLWDLCDCDCLLNPYNTSAISNSMSS